MRLVYDVRFRIGVLAIFAMVGLWLMLPTYYQAVLTNLGKLLVVAFAPALMIGVAWGWLKLDARAGLRATTNWAVVTGILFGIAAWNDPSFLRIIYP